MGAGPSGLVTARHAADAGLAPTIFDKSKYVGGAWNPHNTLRWPTFRANISRLACQFSGHPWNDKTALFPTQADIGQYLDDYCRLHVSPRSVLLLGAEVCAIEPTSCGWKVWWQHSDELRQQEHFDFMVVATGFFSKRQIPNISLATFRGATLHSDDYGEATRFTNQRVVVVGGSFSAIDIAADVARHARAVFNLAPQPFWVLPRFLASISPTSAAAVFRPLDLLLYSRIGRSQAHEQPPRTMLQNRALNQFFADLGASPVMASRAALAHSTDAIPTVVSDSYVGMLNVAKIKPMQGRLVGAGTRHVTLDDGRQIDDVDTIILCSGYSPDLTFLDERTRACVDLRQDDPFLPLALDNLTLHPDLPKAAFVGMYRGPYFGVMEMQARLCTALFAEGPQVLRRNAGPGTDTVARAERLRALRPRPAFPHPDYVGIMQEFGDMLDVAPPASWTAAHPTLLPTDFGDDEIRDRGAHQADAVLQAAEHGRFVAEAVFRSLIGSWTYSRVIKSVGRSLPSGEASGTATFTPSTSPSQLCYAEEGTFSEIGVGGSGRQHGVTQRYLYELDEKDSRIAIKRQGPDSTGELLHSICFFEPAASPAPRPAGQWSASASLTCGSDHYASQYIFEFDRQDVAAFSIEHQVKGAKKDYVSQTKFVRLVPER